MCLGTILGPGDKMVKKTDQVKTDFMEFMYRRGKTRQLERL